MNSPLLSVCLITYNHAKYIREAIESVLMQKVNFSWELIIADDFSTDGTREIVLEYKEKYPELIKLILQEKNVGAAQNWKDLIYTPKSKYIAYFEGDDYWTDSDKLQKQVDFLEANPEYSFCFHEVIRYDELKQEESYFNNWKTIKIFNVMDLTQGNFIATCSVVFRNEIKNYPIDFLKLEAGDWGLHVLNAEKGDFAFLPDCMGVYRININSVWASQSHDVQVFKSINIIVQLDKLTSHKYKVAFYKSVRNFIEQYKLYFDQFFNYHNLLSVEANTIVEEIMLDLNAHKKRLVPMSIPISQEEFSAVYARQECDPEILQGVYTKKYLNLGCGSHYHPTWINIDFHSTGTEVIAHNLNKGIPFEDFSFDVVYHSHLLEHFPKQNAPQFMQECHRVLKDGGIIRVVVPDLEQIVRWYLKLLDESLGGNQDAQKRYNWIMLELFDQMVRNVSGGETLKYWKNNPMPAESFVIERCGSEVLNVLNAIRENGTNQDCNQSISNISSQQIGDFRLSGEIHQWMYDRYSLSNLMELAGFDEIHVCRANESIIPNFNSYLLDIELDGSIRKPDSLFIEAKKKRKKIRTEEKKTMKIVHLCMQDFGGAGNAAYRLHKGLQSIGIDSTMVVLNKRSVDPSVKVLPISYDTDSMINCMDVDSFISPVWQSEWAKWVAGMSQYPKRPNGLEMFSAAETDVRLDLVREIFEADIINLHWTSGLVDISCAPLAFRNKPVVWTLHDMNPFTGGCHYADTCKKYMSSCGACPQLGSENYNDISHKAWNQKRIAYEKLNINIITPSKWLGKCASKSSLFSKYPLVVIPNGFPIDIYKPHPKKEIRNALNISEKANVILFGADDISNKRKGFKYLLDALNNLKVKGKAEIVLLTFGNIWRNIEIKSNVSIINLGAISDQNQLAAVYSAADLFVIPSLEDNLPNTAVESMACGTPVLGFNIGGIPDMVEHQKTGYLAKPKDVNGLIEGITWIISASAETRLKLSNQCRKKAEELYALDIQANNYKKIYEDLNSKEHSSWEEADRFNNKGEELFSIDNSVETESLIEDPEIIEKTKIVLAVNLVPTDNQNWYQRQQACVESINNVKNMNIVPLNICYKDEVITPDQWNVLPALKQSANVKLKFEGKRKPFVDDIFNLACSWAEQNGAGWFAYTNNDIIITSKLIKTVFKLISEGFETIIVSRNEIDFYNKHSSNIPGEMVYLGSDVYFINVNWWLRNRRRFHSYILGERAWDNAYASIMMCHSKGKLLYINGLCLHVKHQTNWLTGDYASYNMSIYYGVDSIYKDAFSAFSLAIGKIGAEKLTLKMYDVLVTEYFGRPTSLIHPEFIKGLTTIIIPVKSLHLNECVSSIKNYTDEPHEIIFLEHDAAPKLKKQIIKATKWNQNYKFIKIDKNIDFTQSINEGINQSTGEYIVILFDDVVVYERWLSDMIECLSSGKKIGIVGAMSNEASNLQRVDGIDSNTPENRSSFRERNRHSQIHTRTLDGFCMLFKRDLLIQIGIFDMIFGGDKHVFDDFCVRAEIKGFKNVIAEDVFVHNQGGINRVMTQDKTLFDEKWKDLDDLNQTPPGEPHLKLIDADMLRTMPVLLCYPGSKENWSPPVISENEIFCGPDCTTSRGLDGLKEIRTNIGSYDISLILTNIPKHQWPELYVVRPTINNLPVNASILNCPKVVIIGKDFYDPSQVNTLAEYLDSEKFDYILIDTSQIPVDLFDPDADHKPLSLYRILTGASPASGENYTDIFGYISLERESLSVLSNLILLGERLYSAGKTVEAMKCFTHVITNSGDNDSRCQAFNNIGVIAHSINEMDRAEQMFISALEIDSMNIHALLNLSDVYLTQGRHDNAMTVLKKAIAAHPGNDQISERLALITPVSNAEETFENREKHKSAELPIHLENTSIYRENLTFSSATPFIVCAMFAGSTKYENYADRLALSCEEFDLPYSIYHVPEIHHSMFLKGGSNLSFTKANFIYNCLDRFVAKTIVYLDIDLVIVDKPQLLINNSKEGVEFSIYNWLSDPHNEAYMPINGRLDPDDYRSSLYTYSHHIAYNSTEQLICSGATQLWGNTTNARKLLRDWQTTIIENNMQADDPCLDIAFNNLGIPIKASWLPKEYIRIPWWPHIKPVILHRDIPASGGERPSEETGNRKRLYPNKLQIKTGELIFPKGYVIDTKKQQLKKIENNTIVDINTIPIDVEFWIHSKND